MGRRIGMVCASAVVAGIVADGVGSGARPEAPDSVCPDAASRPIP